MRQGADQPRKGRDRMKIYVVGIGPGDRADMTPRAVDALSEAEVIVGYGTYIELIKDIIDGKEIISSTMTRETERCRTALECALAGRCAAVVSSGDAGVYGMASLVYEICAGHPEVEIEVIPGITAACSGAAVAGAPIGHDFAVISLSDRLTSWEVIEKRLRLAAEADFVICLYNPSSKKRSGYLKRACECIAEYKSAETQCACAVNIGRNGERYEIYTLDELKDVHTDMFTTVFIGNSETRVINGRLVTPRGYRI